MRGERATRELQIQLPPTAVNARTRPIQTAGNIDIRTTIHSMNIDSIDIQLSIPGIEP